MTEENDYKHYSDANRNQLDSANEVKAPLMTDEETGNLNSNNGCVTQLDQVAIELVSDFTYTKVSLFWFCPWVTLATAKEGPLYFLVVQFILCVYGRGELVVVVYQYRLSS